MAQAMIAIMKGILIAHDHLLRDTFMISSGFTTS